jgi:hypothetical protein
LVCAAIQPENTSDVSRTELEDELARFKIWATNIGAMNVGKASLDHRLRDAEYLHEDVTSLLKDLQENLREGFITINLV